MATQLAINATPAAVTVLGAGAFGSVLANMMADNGHQVTLWLKDKKKADELTRCYENKVYLPGYPLNKNLRFSADIGRSCAQAEVIFVAVPSSAYRTVLAQLNGSINKQQIFVSTAKGIEQQSFLRMSEIIEQEISSQRIAVLSGPNLAKEIALKKPTATVIASHHKDIIKRSSELLMQPYFRIYGSEDVFAVELAGALKNIYAIASGMAHEISDGANTSSMLITRSLAEMSRFVSELGGNPATLLGLAGVGDLIASCSSPLSRNFQLGQLIARGADLAQAKVQLKQTVEGVNTVRMAKNKADELNIYMPIVSGLYRILFEQEKIHPIIDQLMLGEQNRDVEYVFKPGV